VLNWLNMDTGTNCAIIMKSRQFISVANVAGPPLWSSGQNS
jgi:hypothetical protein